MKATRIYELGTAHCVNAQDGITRAEKIIDIIAKYDPNGWFKIQYYESAEQLCTADAIFKSGLNQVDVANKYRLTRQQAESILLYARGHGLKAGATFYTDFKELPFEVDFIKIASPDAVDYRLLRSAFYTKDGIPIIISTGGTSDNELEQLADEIRRCRGRVTQNHPVSLLFCISEYPQPKYFTGKDFKRIRDLFSICHLSLFTPGYSDHSHWSNWGSPATRITAAMGAGVFERHVELPNTSHIDSDVCMQLDEGHIKNWIELTESPDNDDYASLDAYLFDASILYTRKYWSATKDIGEGVVLKDHNVTLKRCMTKELYKTYSGFSMGLYDGKDDVLDQIYVAKTPIKKGELITSTNTERNQ